MQVELSTHTLFSELQRRAEMPASEGRGLTFVRKKGPKNTYWYLQTRIGAVQRQFYVGPDDKELRAKIEAHNAAWAEHRPLRRRRKQLVKMIETGGLSMFTSAEARVLEVVSQAGTFRAGGVLVGSFAFRAYGQVFGRQWERALVMTNDIDIASAAKIGAAIGNDPVDTVDLRKTVLNAEPGFIEIPALNRIAPSTKFSLRNQELSVEFLTPMLGPDSEAPVLVRSLGTYATPIRFLDYLIEKPERVTLAAGSGIDVNVPDPGRFAVHKLVVAGRRRSMEAEKIRKDLAQAGQVLRALLESQPNAIQEAIIAAETYGVKFWREAGNGFAKLDRDLLDSLESQGVMSGLPH